MAKEGGGNPVPLRAGLIATPYGQMVAAVNDDGALVRLDFLDGDFLDGDFLDGDFLGGEGLGGEDGPPAGGSTMWNGLALVRDHAAIADVGAQLDEYFAGRRRSFDLSLAPQGNAFLQRAWRALRDVPYGTTVSYRVLAGRLDPPTSARAMGRANAVNPISIVVPCHRVIGANGNLTGYAGGLDRKAALLELEGAAAGAIQMALPLDRRKPVGLPA